MIRAVALLLALTLLPASAAAQWTSPELLSLRDRFDSVSVNAERSKPLSPVTLELPGFTADLKSGTLFPLVDDTGAIHGAVFTGEGVMELTPPDPLEAAEMLAVLGDAPFTRELTAAFIRTSDPTVRAALGLDAGWAPGSKDNAAGNIGEKRGRLLGTDMGRYNPRLTLDLLRDEVEGSAGGHSYIEVKIKGTAKGKRVPTAGFGWVSYLHNPRGALFPLEPTAVFLHRARGSATQEVFVATSFGDDGAPYTPPWDLLSADLTVTPSFGVGGKAKDIAVNGRLRARSTGGEVPLLVLETVDTLRWCEGWKTEAELSITSLVDDDGVEIPAVKIDDRLVIVPETPLTQDKAAFNFESNGTLVGTVSSDRAYTMLDDMPWYPRNVYPDRHRVSIELRLPDWLNAVATGRLIDEKVDAGERILKFKEGRGVLRAAVSFGHFEVFGNDPEDGQPEIRLAMLKGEVLNPNRVLEALEATVQVMSIYWGPYPLDALSVTRVAHAQAVWTCPPPDDIFRWEGFANGTGGCINEQYPRLVPPFDSEEERDLSYLFDTGTNFFYLTQVAAQWWGQTMFARSYRDEWLITGQAHLAAAIYLDAVQPDTGITERIGKWRATVDQRSAAGPIRMADRLAQGYGKRMFAHAPLLLYSFKWLLPGTGYVDAVRRTMNNSQGGALRSEDFQAAVRDILQAPDAPILDYWVDGTALPDVAFSYSFAPGDKGWTASITVEVSDPAALPFGIPVAVKVKKKRAPEVFVLILTEPTKTYTLEGISNEPKRVEMNPDGRVLIGTLSKRKD